MFHIAPRWPDKVNILTLESQYYCYKKTALLLKVRF